MCSRPATSEPAGASGRGVAPARPTAPRGAHRAAHRAAPRAAPRTAGFTLLECVIATLVMTLMVYGWMRLHSAHARLVGDLDAGLGEHPVYYVDKPESAAARVLGAAARLSELPAAPPVAADPLAPFTVTILAVERDLRPPTATARVALTEN